MWDGLNIIADNYFGLSRKYGVHTTEQAIIWKQLLVNANASISISMFAAQIKTTYIQTELLDSNPIMQCRDIGK